MASRPFTLVAPLAALLLTAELATAQQAPQPPQCRELRYRTNFRLNGAQQYLEQAQRARFPEDKTRAIQNALRVLSEAAQAGGADQLTLWHFFGQAYALQKDYVAADSAWRRAEAVAEPDCRREIALRRRNEWVPIANGAIDLARAGNEDSAMTLFRLANVIYRDEPFVFLNMGSMFASREETDSAVAYFRSAARAGDDPRTADHRALARFNVARLLHRSAQDSLGMLAEVQRTAWPDSVPAASRYGIVRANGLRAAETAYREHLNDRPRDLEALAGLAGVLISLNRSQEAGAIYDQLLSSSDSLGSFELFSIGVALFRQDRYAQAAQAFDLGLRRNPSFRDAWYNLTNTYLAARDTARLLDAAQHLIALDSMNRQSLQLLAAAYQRRGDTQATLRTLMRRDSLPWEVSVITFEPGDSSAVARGSVMNLRSRPLQPFTLTFEFVNGANEVVAQLPVQVPQLASLNSHDFSLNASGRGILAWRYKTN